MPDILSQANLGPRYVVQFQWLDPIGHRSICKIKDWDFKKNQNIYEMFWLSPKRDLLEFEIISMRKKALNLNSMLYFVVKESTVINLLNMSWWTHLMCLKVYSWS